MAWSGKNSVAGTSTRRKGLGGVGRGISRHIIRDLPLFILFYLYLWLVIEPHLIFHGADRITNFPSFYNTWAFFASCVSRPGGLVEYLSAFLSQLLYFSWLGALVITIQAWVFGLLAAYLVGRMGLPRRSVVAYVPALLLLAIYGQYAYFFPTTVALLCALAMASVYVSLAARRRPAVSTMLFVGLSLMCYCAAGAAALLLGLTCAIPEFLLFGRRRLAVLYLLAAAAFPCVFGVGFFGMSTVNAYTDLLPISWKLLYFAARRRGVETIYVLYLFTPGVMTIAGVVSALRTREQRSTKVEEGCQPKGKRADGWRAVLSYRVESPVCRWLAHTVALVAVGAAVACGSLDRARKTHLAVDYYAYHRMWPEVLTESRKGIDDPFVMHAVNRALYHTGQLGNSMFAWPQKPTYLFLADTGYQWVYWQNYAVYLELGFINYAENALMECLSAMGDRPMLLQQLATIHMAKGNIDTARVYLHTLSATLFHGTWARHYLDLLDRDPELATDEKVQGLRWIAMNADYPSLHLSEENLLSCLLEKNGKNRMAFEYLMVWHLLNRQLTRFIQRLEELPDLGYVTLPRHYEEAIWVYSTTARTTIQLRGYEPRGDVRSQMEQFLGVLRSHGGDKQAAFAELAGRYGDTYAFYNVYGPRGKTR